LSASPNRNRNVNTRSVNGSPKVPMWWTALKMSAPTTAAMRYARVRSGTTFWSPQNIPPTRITRNTSSS
jgi:hypothetical protein